MQLFIAVWFYVEDLAYKKNIRHYAKISYYVSKTYSNKPINYSFSRSKYFHLLIAPIEGFITLIG